MSVLTLSKVASPSSKEEQVMALFEQSLDPIREEMQDNPYLQEAIRVLPVGGYRSAIGSIWNAVVDDLRNKIIHRSLSLFNKTVKPAKELKTYEDFQNNINDDQLIDGAYGIGVIGWEASKVLKHAKETRHIFSGHPRSGEPSIYKVMGMLDDCVRYVLQVEYPNQIVDIDEYMGVLASESYDRDEFAVETGLGDLPEIHKNELAHRLFTAYIHVDTSTVLRSNIAFAVPILWKVLDRSVRQQVVRRVDGIISKADGATTERAFDFVRVVRAARYLSAGARKYKIRPLVERLEKNLDAWSVENATVKDLEPYAAYIPLDLVPRYVLALTKTYVGYTGCSLQFSRTDFYANGAAARIPGMFDRFDDTAAEAFVEGVRRDKTLRNRITDDTKLDRLRDLGKIVKEKVSPEFPYHSFLSALTDDAKAEEFVKELNR